MITPDSKLISYRGVTLQTIGKINFQITHANANIVNKSSVPLIALQSSIDLGLIELTYLIDNNTPAMTNSGAGIHKHTVINDCCDLFRGVGMIPGSAKLHLKDDAVPTINHPRHISGALKAKLNSELDRLQ